MLKKQAAQTIRLYSLIRPHFLRHAIVAFAAGLAPVLSNIIMANALRDVFRASTGGDALALGNAILVFALSIGLFFVFNGTMWGFMGSSIARITGRTRKALFSHLLNLPAAALSQNHSAAAMTIFTSDVQAAEYAYGNLLRFSMSSALCGLVATVITFLKSPVMASIILSTALLQLVLNIGLVKPLQRLSGRIAGQIEAAGAALGNLLEGNVTIRLYGMQSHQLKRYEEKSLELRSLNRKLSLVEGIIKGANILAGLGGYLLTLAIGTELVSRGAMGLPDLLYLTQIRGLVMLVVFSISDFSQMMQPAAASMERIFAFLDKPQEKQHDGQGA